MRQSAAKTYQYSCQNLSHIATCRVQEVLAAVAAHASQRGAKLAAPQGCARAIEAAHRHHPATIMTFALNGLAVGLGVLYPNFKEANPSKIVSGFGGTLCLVLSFVYILASVLLLGLGTTGLHPHPGWVFGTVSSFAVLSFVIGWIPLRLGLQQLPKFEF